MYKFSSSCIVRREQPNSFSPPSLLLPPSVIMPISVAHIHNDRRVIIPIAGIRKLQKERNSVLNAHIPDASVEGARDSNVVYSSRAVAVGPSWA
eukprot:14981559-Heterocapsa_arctica.AAC.1